MPDHQNKLDKFWQQLKRRKVIRVIIVYATTAFILLQLVDLIKEPLNLPHWIMTFFIVLLLIGFPIAVIFSWIFDITPQGIEITESDETTVEKESYGFFSKKNLVSNIIIGILLIIVLILAYPKIFTSKPASETEKSIAILPFIDDSQEEGNDYIINGLMESILNNLCKIQDLRVISRTSVEKYRNNPKQISEIAQELNVKYIVEGSGQKNENKVLLTVQLIDATTDKHLWSEQYKRDADDIIDLQIEVAKTITEQIQVKITPEEKKRIEKLPTENSAAYDLFTKGNEILITDEFANVENLQKAKSYFEKAIELDNKFALAYATLSFTYYYLNIFSEIKDEKYFKECNKYADLALLADPQLSQSLLAKAIYYYSKEEYDLAIPYLENSLHYTPNFYSAIITLQKIYSYYHRNLEKSLEYGLKAIRIEFAEKDSTAMASDYISLSETFRYAGFFDMADEYLNKSKKYITGKFNTESWYALEREELILDTKSDYKQAKSMMMKLLEKDSSAANIVVMARNCYFLREWENAYNYYKKIPEEETIYYRGKLSFVCKKTGMLKEAEINIKKFEDYINNDNPPNKYRLLCQLQSIQGKTEEALSSMKFYAKQENVPYWFIRYFKDEPIYDNIRDLPEFQQILSEMEANFWANHERIKTNLTEKGLLPLKI